MEYNKLVSVVMPVHNGERFLREAIESVLSQTYTNFELLIIENCSSDSSVEIIKSYNDPRIKLIIEEDRGQVQAYNRGFREAKGEYVFIHDQDDVSHPERFVKQLRYIIKNRLDIVGSFFEIINKDGKILSKLNLPIFHEEIEKQYYYKVISLYNPTLCLKKQLIYSLGDFNPDCFPSSDFEFILRNITKVRVGNIPEFLLKWRNHNYSLSHQNIRIGTNNALKISIKYLEQNKKRYSHSEYLYIKAYIYYYYNKLSKSLFFLIINANYWDMRIIKLLLKIIFLFIPIKLLRINDFFNHKIVYDFRKMFKAE